MAYFGEPSSPCGDGQHACDNCAARPEVVDATDVALTAVAVVDELASKRQSYGATYLIEYIVGKASPNAAKRGHVGSATFGVGARVCEERWKAVFRQLIALGFLRADGDYGVIVRTDRTGEIGGGTRVLLRKAADRARPACASRSARGVQQAVDDPLFSALKAWRRSACAERNVPAYAVFSDAALADIARLKPSTLAGLGGVSGVGEKKLESYGASILRVVAAQQPADPARLPEEPASDESPPPPVMRGAMFSKRA